MNMRQPILAAILLIVTFLACERPKSPDFKLNHQVEAPLAVNKTYVFLGGEDALVDTTQKKYENLFVAGENGLVRLSREESFSFGNLNNAIPEINAQPAALSTEVGEIRITNFNSAAAVDSASFEQITGASSPLQQGDPVPGSSTPAPVNISFNPDYFERAVIKEEGIISITLTNNLGFDLQQLSITLNSGSTAVGSGTISPFANNATGSAVITIPASTVLENLNVDVSASWSSGTTMEEDAGSLLIEAISGQNLVASEVTAAVESQSFQSSGTADIDNDKFEFRENDDFVELGNGQFSVDIQNSINLGLEQLTIRFPGIREANTDAPLELVMRDIPSRQAGGTFTENLDLTNYRIYAQGNSLNYTVSATTENNQGGTNPDLRTIHESDALSSVLELNNLQISRASGFIVPRAFLLNTDQTSDGRENLDVFNDQEAETINIEGISDLSERLSDITFTDPTLSALYSTNLGVNTTIYALIAGINSKGETSFLVGREGSEFDVQSGAFPAGLEMNGQPATASQLIKFSVDTADAPDPQAGEPGENIFNARNSNASEFFSSLPTSIRFVGLSVVNEKRNPGVVVNPVIFEPRVNAELPLDFSADNASFTDTLEADLGSLPGEGDSRELIQATLTVNYTNGLPLDLRATVTFLDGQGQPITTKENISIEAGTVASGGYVEEQGKSTGKAEISFSSEELKILNQSRNIELDIQLDTPGQETVKVRAEDTFTIGLTVNADITSTVN